MEENKRKKAPNVVLAVVCVTLIIFFAVLFAVVVINYNKVEDKPAQETKKVVPENKVEEEPEILENEVKENTSTVEPEPEEKEDEEVSGEVKLTEGELDALEQYLETREVNCLVNLVKYDNPREINLQTFLRYFPGDTIATPEQAQEITGMEDPPTPVHLYEKSYIDNFFKEHTGIGVDELEFDTSKLYLEKYNSYYTTTSDATSTNINLISGTVDGNNYVIIYDLEDGTNPKYELTLKKENGKYIFVSNIARY